MERDATATKWNAFWQDNKAHIMAGNCLQMTANHRAFLIKYQNEFHKTNWVTDGYCWCVGGYAFSFDVEI